MSQEFARRWRAAGDDAGALINNRAAGGRSGWRFAHSTGAPFRAIGSSASHCGCRARSPHRPDLTDFFLRAVTGGRHVQVRKHRPLGPLSLVSRARHLAERDHLTGGRRSPPLDSMPTGGSRAAMLAPGASYFFHFFLLLLPVSAQAQS